MLVPYIRSSSLNQYKFCQMRYTFEYLFGFPGKSGAKALMGTIFHKAQELRSQASKAMRAKEDSFVDDNIGETLCKDAVNVEWAHEQAFNYYTSRNQDLGLGPKEFKETLKWVHNALSEYPEYDPLNLDIVQTEQKFDIEIKEPWAKFKGKLNSGEVSGNLSIKGTMDLVIRHNEDTYELLDYKSGQYRSDFATGEEKTLEYLNDDIQLLLYLIALDTLFPGKNWILTLFYIRNGGLFSVVGDADMLKRAYAMLEKMFKEISACQSPTQFDPYNKDWRCKHLCPFSKPDSYTRGQTVCQHYKQKIDRKGLEVVQLEVANEKKLFLYGDGGGRAADE